MCKYCDSWRTNEWDYVSDVDFVKRDGLDVAWLESEWIGSEDGEGDVYPALCSCVISDLDEYGMHISMVNVDYCPFCGRHLLGDTMFNDDCFDVG